jgi:hypothetical protein
LAIGDDLLLLLFDDSLLLVSSVDFCPGELGGDIKSTISLGHGYMLAFGALVELLLSDPWKLFCVEIAGN